MIKYTDEGLKVYFWKTFAGKEMISLLVQKFLNIPGPFGLRLPSHKI